MLSGITSSCRDKEALQLMADFFVEKWDIDLMEAYS